MWTRRRILLATLAGFGGLAAGRLAVADARSAIIMVLRKRLWFLQLDEEGVQQFATDLATLGVVSEPKLKMIQATAPLYRRIDFTGRHSVAMTLRHGEERIVSTYLMASDFFLNGADESKVVRYVRLYQPAKNLDACSAPFSRPIVTS
jgi:hypothetical protein